MATLARLNRIGTIVFSTTIVSSKEKERERERREEKNNNTLVSFGSRLLVSSNELK